jgi:hypothetical protein
MLAKFADHVSHTLDEIKAQGLFKTERIITGPQNAKIPIADGRKYRLRVTYGAFPDRDAANDAARRLPPKYRQAFRPEPRDFNELRTFIGGLPKNNRPSEPVGSEAATYAPFTGGDQP